MIWANGTVAQYVYQRYENYSVLRRQAGPDEQELSQLQSQHVGTLGHSVTMSTLVTSEPSKPLVIPYTTLYMIQEAIESENILKLQRLLTSDYLYPQLAVAEGHLRRISQRAEYVCSDLPITDSSSPFRHHSLCLDYYTHFTSPIRRYCDVVVQRLLLSILNNQSECSYTAQELDALCRHFNIHFRAAKEFEKKFRRLTLAQQLGESSKETNAYVCRNNNTFGVIFTEPKYMNCLTREKADFYISALVCENKDEILRWKVFMFSFSGNDFVFENPQLSQVASDDERLIDSENTAINMTVFYRQEIKDLQESSDEEDSSELIDETPELTVEDSFDLQSMDESLESTDDELEEQTPMLKYELSLIKTKVVMKVDAEKWQSVIRNVTVDNLTVDAIQELSAVLPKAQPQEQDSQQVYDPITVERFRQSPIVKYEVACKLGSNSIVPVWLGQTLIREHIISPCVQLIEVAPELRICLQHNKHPADCFSDPHLSQASKGKYKSLEEYVSLWEKVFLAEVAQDSVLNTQDKPINILKNVPLQWPNLKIPDNSVDDYYLPQGPVIFTIPPESQSFLLYNMKISPGDLVCVRYDVKEEQCRAVYHLVVRHVHKRRVEKKSEKDVIDVEMEHIGKHSCQISSKMAKILRHKHPTCELQVVNLQESYR